MSRGATAKILTAAALAGLALFAGARQNGWRLPVVGGSPERVEEPRDAVYRLLDAAREGDVEAYLACHSGEMRRRLEQSRDEMSQAEFRQYLQARNRLIKGVAVNEPNKTSADRATLEVEYVYEDRNETQRFYLERSAGDWRIARADPARRTPTLVPYGTPVY